MSDPQQEEGRPSRRSDEAQANALAGSTPDLAHNFLRVSEGMVNSGSRFKVFAGTTLMSQLLFFTIGLSSMVGAALLIDKVNEGMAARRGFNLEMFKLQTDLELAKLDRTMLGEGAMATLKAIVDKIDLQGETISQIQQSQKTTQEGMQRLSAEVGSLRQGQAATDRRVGGLAASQAQMRERMGKGP